MTRSKYYAVLTGDIIQSSRLTPTQLESVRSSLIASVNAVRRWQPGLVKGKPEFFRGDAWQLLLTDTAMALRVGVFLRASLLSRGLADSRVAIGLGEVEEISHERVSFGQDDPVFKHDHRGPKVCWPAIRLAVGREPSLRFARRPMDYTAG